MKIKDGSIRMELEKVYRLIDTDAPESKEKKQTLLKLDEAQMWFDRIDWFEEDIFDEEKDEEEANEVY